MGDCTSTSGGTVTFPLETVWPAEIYVIVGPIEGIETLPDGQRRVVYETRESMVAALSEMVTLELEELEARLENGLEKLAKPKNDEHWARLLERFEELAARHEVVRQVGGLLNNCIEGAGNGSKSPGTD